jgi:hypothetical protein
VGFSLKRNGKRLTFPALVQCRRKTVGACHPSPALIGSGTTPAWQISNIRIVASADERRRLAERGDHRAAAAWLQLI